MQKIQKILFIDEDNRDSFLFKKKGMSIQSTQRELLVVKQRPRVSSSSCCRKLLLCDVGDDVFKRAKKVVSSQFTGVIEVGVSPMCPLTMI